MFDADKFIMPKIQTVFKKDPATKLVIPELNPEMEWVRNGVGLITIWIDGIHIKVKKDSTGKTRVYRQLKGYASSGAYIQVHEKDKLDQPIWEAFESLINKEPGIYVAYGKDIERNPQGADKNYMIKVIPVSGSLMIPQQGPDFKIKRGPEVSVEEFFDSVRSELLYADVKGLIFQYEQPSLNPIKFAKVSRKNFGFSWPIQPESVTEPDDKYRYMVN